MFLVFKLVENYKTTIVPNMQSRQTHNNKRVTPEVCDQQWLLTLITLKPLFYLFNSCLNIRIIKLNVKVFFYLFCEGGRIRTYLMVKWIYSPPPYQIGLHLLILRVSDTPLRHFHMNLIKRGQLGIFNLSLITAKYNTKILYKSRVFLLFLPLFQIYQPHHHSKTTKLLIITLT